MTDITFDRLSIGQALQNKYSLPTYQRDYKWTEKQFSELLSDLQESFLKSYDPSHGRKEIGTYESYFLGTIITTQLSGGIKSIIDGQQRLITLTLILSYFQRIRLRSPSSGITDLDNMIRKELYGDKDYNLSFDGPKKDLFDILLDPHLENDDLEDKISSINGIDESSRHLFNLFESIDNYIDSQFKSNLLPHFVDYIVNKVLLFDIGVPSEQDAHKVFVTMNDRGLKLSPIDLLKGYLLSNIVDTESNSDSHQKWITTINSLKQIALDEDSNFIKTWLRAKYAQNVRGKTKGAQPEDFEIIGDSYHRWVMDNKSKLALSTSDDYEELLSKIIPSQAQTYIKIKKSENESQAAHPHLFYNGAKNITLQSMLILASINNDDTSAIINKKMKLCSIYLDILTTIRTLNSQDNNYDNIRDIIFNQAKKIRGLNVESLCQHLKSELTPLLPNLDKIKDITYGDYKRQDILHLLSRIADYLENICQQTTAVGFSTYICRTASHKTFDIEHVLSNNIEKNKIALGDNWDFTSDSEHNKIRDNIGNLVLIPRGRNRSLKDKPYAEKSSVYAGENILCQSLTSSFMTNNPTAMTGLENMGINIPKIDNFNKKAILSRAELYYSVTKKIWSLDNLDAAMQ